MLSNLQRRIRPAAEDLLLAWFRRSLLVAAAHGANIQMTLDCAEIALAIGLRDEARLLFEAAFLTEGYDAAGLMMQRHYADGTDLWEQTLLRSSDNPLPFADLTTDAAAAALTGLIALCSDDRPSTSEIRTPRLSLAMNDGALALEAINDIAHGINALHGALRRSFDALAVAEPLDLLRQNLLAGEIPIEEHVDAPLGTLVRLLAAKTVRRLLLRAYHLVEPPLGSARLFHYAAGLKRPGLGPYLLHTGYLVRDAREAISFVLSSLGYGLDAAAVHRAIALLANGLAYHDRLELVDLLADAGMLAPIVYVAAQHIAGLSVGDERELIARLRDALIDLDQPALAIGLQHRLCVVQPFDFQGWEVLGNLMMNAGDYTGAKNAYGSASRLRPADCKLAAKLAAANVKSDRGISVEHIYGSAPARQQRRRAALARRADRTAA